jgi:hypothetical protein
MWWVSHHTARPARLDPVAVAAPRAAAKMMAVRRRRPLRVPFIRSSLHPRMRAWRLPGRCPVEASRSANGAGLYPEFGR